MDYGRCLQSFWSETAESKRLGDEDIDEIAKDCVKEAIGGGVFAPLMKKDINESIDFVIEHGFKPFKINLKSLQDRLNVTKEKTKGTKLEYYTKFKISLLMNVLHNEQIKRLWVEDGGN